MSRMKQAIEDGACLICLGQGTVKYPLDPHAHEYMTGHWPVLAKGAPMISQSGAVPAPGGPMTDPRGNSTQQERTETPSLRELYRSRIRKLNLADWLLFTTAIAIIVASATVIPGWWALALLPVLYLRGCVIITRKQLIKNLHDPLFYLAAIRHDLR